MINNKHKLTHLAKKFVIQKIGYPSIIISIILTSLLGYAEIKYWINISKQQNKIINQQINIFFNLTLKQLRKLEVFFESKSLNDLTTSQISLPSFADNLFILDKKYRPIYVYPEDHKIPYLNLIFDNFNKKVAYSRLYYSINLNKLAFAILDNARAKYSYLVEMDIDVFQKSIQKLVETQKKEILIVTDNYGNVIASSLPHLLDIQENINYLKFFKKLKKNKNIFYISIFNSSPYFIFGENFGHYQVIRLIKPINIVLPLIYILLITSLILISLNIYFGISINNFIYKTISKHVNRFSEILDSSLDNKFIVKNLNKLKSETKFKELDIVIRKLIYYLNKLNIFEETLKEKNQDLEFLLNNLPMWIWYLNDPTTFGIINKNLADFFGLNIHSYIYQKIPFERLSSQELTEATKRENKYLFEKGKTIKVKRWFTNKNGQKRLIAITKQPIFDEKGQVKQAICFGLDITENYLQEEKRKQLEEQLRRMQKMEAIGTLSSGIAHHFSNLLQAIYSYLNILKRSQNNIDKNIFEKIDEQIKKGKSLVQSLLAATHKTPEEFEIFELNKFIQQILDIIQSSYPKNIKIKSYIEQTKLYINGNQGLLEQAILNITNNAKDVLKTKTQAEINITIASETINKQNYIKIKISDNGPGIPSKHQNKVFEPFFTTKDIGKGTGLGLYLTYQIIKMHKGKINFITNNKGTTFIIYLPQSNPPTYPKTNNSYLPKPPFSATILTIEDEELILDGVKDFLEDKGLKVIGAKDGEQGLELFYKLQNKLDIVILDLGLPGIPGKEILTKITKYSSNIKIIVCSGYHHHEIAKNPQKFKVSAFLSKPYELEDLYKVILKILEVEQ
ncbi:PAS domain S-box-containing protein [Desulfonauticus submarinus]|uniref:histidine kinase n=1 Tax=Desulfonauticus submarinus TaxID=206665 RepID=A0A1H0AEC9_9BACT|nr:PAS domain-containing sensor histidine kinase [Desulfonauticus submarinus]SDN31373.1 PAS domain S-box-containing protein [Desulfonauticus submarinus]